MEANNIIVSLSASTPRLDAPKIKASTAGFISFGAKNNFPKDLLAISTKSPVHMSIVSSKTTYMLGKGFKNSESNKDKYIGVPNPGEKWEDVFKKMAIDFNHFYGFYGQVVLNKDSTTVSVFHQDFVEVRIGKVDDYGEPLTFKISKDWKKVSTSKPAKELDVWPGVDKAKPGVAYMFYYYEYFPGQEAYCVPGYFPAIDYLRADGALAEFYSNCIDNGFSPSAVISMPTNPAKEVQDEFQKKMEARFTGAKGASKVITVWGEDEKTKPTITPFEMSHNADTYNIVEGIVFQKIISAHRLSSPTLAGVSGSGNLSGNAAEIIDAYVLYNYTVVEADRNIILNELNKFTKINKTGELAIDELDVLPKIRETEAPTEEETKAPTTLKRQNKLTLLIKKLLYGNSAVK